MNDHPLSAAMLSRRNLLRAAVVGAAGVGAATVIGNQARPAIAASGFVPTSTRDVHLAATDGWVSMPANARPVAPYWPDPLAPNPYNMYVFGFRDVSGFSDSDVIAQRGRAQISAPTLAFDQGSEIRVSLTNLGLSQRPDLVDGHTMHWHGFNNAIPLFDGVPEMSASVPIGKTMTYLYRPHEAGTYMYHCHFEDVEHVQMGMTGLLYVRPKMNADGNLYVYNDARTQYDREYPVFLSENQPESHYRDAHIQITDWASFNSGFALFNGRAYPDTLEADFDPMGAYAAGSAGERLQFQPKSTLIEANEGETILLRVASLGYMRHTLAIDGVPMHVIGSDADQLIGKDGTDNSFVTNSLDVAPGESRDVLFTAPAPGTYQMYDRNFSNLSNDGGSGYGGMLTELRVYPAGTLPAQARV